MTTPKNNKGGAKEVTTTQNNKTVSNATNNAVKATTTPMSEEKKEEPKTATPLPPKVVELTPKPKTLEEQIEYFLGLEKLVKIVRRLEQHLDKVNELQITDSDLEKFEDESTLGAQIILMDGNNSRYNIHNPRLVKEMLNHLTLQIETKIDHFNGKILEFDPNQKEKA